MQFCEADEVAVGVGDGEVGVEVGVGVCVKAGEVGVTVGVDVCVGVAEVPLLRMTSGMKAFGCDVAAADEDTPRIWLPSS
ncbi:MAG: hypothetical protein RMN52_14660 [Anaerolineae bacterium]|nr:hypothetical protein [Candidatus Roseilinea sp.]MDW8451239.1 hypothetical protein [Anaerolineae bacterium]